MKTGNLVLSILITATLVLMHIDSKAIDLPLTPLFIINDNQSKIARGERISLSTATVIDLEQVPGISTTMALKILEKRDAILAVPEGPLRESALTLVRGIGPKTAAKFAQYLVLK